MSATTVLQRCLATALGPMHASRCQTLLLSVESLLAGRRLVLMDLARSWLGADRVRAPLKRLDRLLGNPRLHAERERIYGGMVRWLRHRTHVKPADSGDTPDQWVPCRALHRLVAQSRARDLGVFDLVRNQPIQARLVLYAKAPQGRQHTTLKGGQRRSKSSRQCARREAEPWLLAVSPSLRALPVPQVVALYRRRMQIELGFRDLKSHRYGQAFEDSLTRKSERIDILLLLHALAVFAAWLAGMAAEADGCQHRINPYHTRRRLYSLARLGWEALTRRWLTRPIQIMLDTRHSLSPEARQNMAVHA